MAKKQPSRKPLSKKQLPDKPAWQNFEKTALDRDGFVERFRRAESTISDHAHEFVTGRWRRIQQVRRPMIVWVLLVAGILLATGVEMVLNQSRYYRFAAADNSSYLEGVAGKISSLNPLFSETEADKLAEQLIFSRLYHYDEFGALKGDLAKSLVISADELSYTVAIRDDVKWHDGEKLTAEDVKYTVDLFKNQAVNSFTGQVMRGVSATVVSDYTVEFKLRSAYAPFPQLLNFAILPKHILHKIDGGEFKEMDFNNTPIGSGQFKFQSFKDAVADNTNDKQILSLVRNENYYHQTSLQRFELHVYQNQEALLKGLRANEVNAVATTLLVGEDQFNGAVFERKVKQLNNGVFAFFNMSRTDTGKLAVRQALRHVMSVEQLRQAKFNQDGILPELNLPILDGYLANKNVVFEVQYDQQVADRLMINSGYRRGDQNKWVGGDGQTLKLELVSVLNTQYQATAESLAERLREFGVEVDLRLLDLKSEDISVAQELFKAKKYDILVYEIGLGADPDVYGFWHSSQVDDQGLNFSNYKNKIADEALVSARLKRDANLRTAKYNTFMKKWLEDVPAVGLYQTNLHYLVQKQANAQLSEVVIDSYDRYYKVGDWAGDEELFYKTP